MPTNAYVERKVEECFQWRAHSCSFSQDRLTQGDLCSGQRRKGRLSSPAPISKAKTDGEEKNSSKTCREESSSDKRSEIPCRSNFFLKKKKTSCQCWHPPVCQNYKSETGCNLEEHVSSDMLRLRKSPVRSPRKVVRKDQLHYWRSQHSWVVYLKIVIRESLFHGRRNIVIKSRRQILQEHLAPNQKFWNEMVHHEELSKSVNFMSVVLRAKLRGTITRGDLAPRKMRSLSGMGFAEHIYKLRNADKATFYSSNEAKVMPAPTSTSPEEREFVVDSGATVHMMSKKDLSSDQLDTPLWCLQAMVKCIQTRKHKFSFTTSISSWQCYYSKKRLLFCRLENSAKTTDILVCGSAVKNHGWPKEWKTIICKTDNFVPLVVPGLSTSSMSNSSSTSPAQERSDELGPREWCRSSSKNPKQTKKDHSRDADDRLRDLPESFE